VFDLSHQAVSTVIEFQKELTWCPNVGEGFVAKLNSALEEMDLLTSGQGSAILGLGSA
jgi:hypothetical protein